MTIAKKAMEMTIEIAGKVAGSLDSTFKKATGNVDDLKKQSYAAQRELARLGREFSKGNIHQSQYATETAKVRSELRKLEGDMRRVSAVNSTLQKGWNTSKAVAGVAAITTATAATAAVASSINISSDFESQISKVQAKTEATTEEVIALRETALQLGASTSLSASETALAMDELAAKGFDTNKIIGAMPGIISAAEASGEDLALVSDVVTSAINAYGLEAAEASRIADIMAMSANQTAAGVADLGQSLKYASPIAKTLGVELEELTAVTGILVDKGLAGEQAGTALRMSLGRLTSDNKAVQKALDKLNIKVTDSEGKFKSLAEITEDWNKATKNLSQTQKVSYANTVFGTESATAMLNVFDAGPEKIREMTKALEESEGAAAKAAAVMKDNYAGAKEEFFGAVESGQIAFATPILGVLKDTFQGVTGTVEENMTAIGAYGERVADGLRDVLDPFATTKPVLTPEIEADPIRHMNYLEELSAYSKFENMDFGDKIIYSLETATDKAEEWLAGSGGETMGRIFTQLGEIAAKAWIAAFTGAIGGSIESALQGNVTGALGLGAAAWMLGGGTMVKGAIGAGKWAAEKRGVRKASAAAPDNNTTSISSSKDSKTAKKTKNKSKAVAEPPVKKATGSKAKVAQKPSVSKSPNLMSRVIDGGKGLLSKGGKALSKVGKAKLPLGIAAGGFNIFKSKEKPKAVAQTPVETETGSKKKAIKNSSVSKSPNLMSRVIDGGKGLLSKGGKALSKVGKIGGKAIAPLGIVTEGFNIFKSKDKTKATSEAAGGLAGGAGGAKLGAAIGTAIAPGIGTAVGGLLGSAVGYIGGKRVGGKAVDTVRAGSDKNAVAEPPAGSSSTQPLDTTQLNASTSALSTNMINLATSSEITAKNMSDLAMYVGQASGTVFGSFNDLKTNSALTANNMSTLATYTGEASGMVFGSFHPLKTSTELTDNNMSILATYTGQASGMIFGSFYPLQTNTTLASNNMSTLATYIGQASGWIFALQGIQTAGQRVITALNNLESRINNVDLPGSGSSKRVSFDG